MIKVIQRAAIAATLAGVASVGLVGVSAQASPQEPVRQVSTSTVEPQVASGYWQNNYYDNYFYFKATCASRGRWMKKNVEGVLAYRCHLNLPPKWSMDIKWKWA